MAVQRRGRRWRAVAYAGGKHRYLGTYDTRAEALAAEAEALAEAAFRPQTSETLGQFLGQWLHAMRYAWSAKHWRNTERRLRLHVIPYLGDVRLRDLTSLALTRLYATLLDKGLSPTTIGHVHSAVRRALKDAPLAVNPAKHATPPKKTKRGYAVWDSATLRDFLDRARGHEDFLFWLLLASTGMRRSEGLRVQWEDFDWQRCGLQVRTSKNGRGRFVTLDPEACAELRQHAGSGYVFRQVHPSTYSKRFKLFVIQEGLPRIRLHDLRHTHATLLIAANVPLKVVSERLGHTSIEVTASIYAHVTQGMDEQAAAVWGKLVT